MPWYVEYKTKTNSRSQSPKKLRRLKCPDNIRARKKAIEQARLLAEYYQLKSPCLIWKETVSPNKRRR